MEGNLPVYVATLIIFAMIALVIAQRTARVGAEAKLLARIRNEQQAVDAGQRQITDILSNIPIGIIAVEGGSRTTIFTNAWADDILKGRYPDRLPFVDDNGEPLPATAHPLAGRAAPSPEELYTLANPDGLRHLGVRSIVVEDIEGGSEIVYVLRDETGRIQNEKALERSHRLEALGTLTNGITHDFNNLLTPIVGGLDMVRRDKGLSDASIRGVDRAIHATNSASALVERLRSFSRQQDMQTRPVGLKDLIDGAYELFGRKLGPGVTAYVTSPTNPTVEVDPQQFELVMLNLLVNARDAFDDEGGDVRITVTEQEVGENGRGLKAGQYARVTVSDNGRGMDGETLARAVEPFFTTKPIGTGSGLGLSMADGFAGQSGGVLTIESHPGQGTRVDIWLPTSGMSPNAVPEEEVEPKTAPLRILLVDDEDMVRSATADMLTELGHTVVQVTSGPTAISAMHRDKEIDAIISDHLMPGMTGGAMALEVWDFAPKTPILLVSGYSKTRGMPTNIPHLAKPFRRIDLAKAIKSLMEPAA